MRNRLGYRRPLLLFLAGLLCQIAQPRLFQLVPQRALRVAEHLLQRRAYPGRVRTRQRPRVKQLSAVQRLINVRQGDCLCRFRQPRSAMRTLLALQQPRPVQQRKNASYNYRIDAQLPGNIFRGLQPIRFGSEQDQRMNAGRESGICGHDPPYHSFFRR